MFVSLAELAAERRALDAQEAAWLKKVAAYDRSGDWSADGFLNAASAVRALCRMDHGVARGHVELARKLEELPGVADAFGRGDISQRHAVVIANAYTPERPADISNVEPQLVAAAREHTPKQLGGIVRYLIDAIDGDGGAATGDALYERRRHHMSATLDGMVAYDGICDPESGAIHTAAINAEMERDHVDHDPRTPAQRRFDALTNLLRRSLDRGEVGESRNVRPHVSVVVDLDELRGTTAELVNRVRTERRHNGHLSAATLERLTCDCDISRVITAGRSEVLDVGRATRTIPPAIWKALVVRDGHCQAPGCDRPPDSCEGHHVVHWTRGGPTNLQNLQLLCWNHHRDRHNHDAQARAA
ncbi:MAG: HNH endonuclease [Actinomycetota bacterium]|nr:HNH endonuclease [Actinomycetota bacterium]